VFDKHALIINCGSQNLMPFLYKIEIKQSPIHGRGVFALEDIPEGATYWEAVRLDDIAPIVGCHPEKNKIYSQESLCSIKD
jgi:hypothetical protein